MFKKEKLKARIIEKVLTVDKVAITIGIATPTLYRKMSGESDFYLKEILKICEILSIDDPKDIFLRLNLRKRNLTNYV